MGVKFTNNAKTTLSASVSTSATSVSVASSSGFPSLSGSDYFYATMVQQSDDTALEIVKVTAVSGTTWTVSRAQDNTSARAFASGDKIELRASAGVFIDLFAEKAPLANPTFTGNITIGNAEISETELEILDGATVTTDELNKLDGTTATAASLTYGKDLYDTGVTAAEFDYLDGVTANIQTQISAKMSEPSGFARGSIIIGDSSGNPANLAAGANGYVLKSDGTDISWAEDEKTTTTNFVKNAFTGDNSTTAFTLSQSPNSEDNLIVFIEGVFQNQGDYSLSGTTLTFDEAPATGRKIVAYHVKAAVSGANLNHDQFTASGSAAFTLSITPINENNTQVFIDGVYQQKTDYSVSGTTLTFDTAPASGAIVEVMTFTQTEINVPTTGSVVTASIANDVNLNGNPTTTTQSAGNNSTRIATTAFVETAVSNLIDSAPGTMNTLNEIAAALGDDPTFTTTVNNAIATKLPLSGGTMTGNIAHASDFTIDVGGDISLDADGDNINFKAGGTDIASFAMSPTSSALELDALGDLTLDVAGDINLDADGGDIYFLDGGTYFGQISNVSSDLIIKSSINDKDILLQGVDNSSQITALTLDMSNAGKATFNAGADFGAGIKTTGNLEVASSQPRIHLDRADGSYSWNIYNGDGSGNFPTSTFNIANNGGTAVITALDSGRVGIGTTSPSYRLTAKSDANTNPAIKVEQTGNTDGWGFIPNNTNGNLEFSRIGGGTAGTHLTITNSGNVGIGETSPAATLHVEHDSSTAYNGAAEITESLIVSNKNGTDNSGVNNVASIGLHVADGATSQGFINYVRSANNQGYFSLSQRTASTTYEEQFTLDREGQAFIKGTSPYMQIRDTTAGGGAGNGGQVIMSGHHAGSGDGFREFAKIVGVKANSTGGDTHGYLGFYVNQGAASSTESMRLDEDGNLGINTVNAGDKLSVCGTVRFNTTPSDGEESRHYFTVGGAADAASYSLYDGGQNVKVYFTGNGASYVTGGNLGVGDSSPAYRLELPNTPNANGQLRCHAVITYSDERIKSNIQTLDYGLDVVKQLKPSKYKHHKSVKEDGQFVKQDEGSDDIGFIAQEVLPLIPEVVSVPEDVDKDLYSISYPKLTAVLTKAIQEQQTIIDDLKARIEALEG